jgi:hypothetical protein
MPLSGLRMVKIGFTIKPEIDPCLHSRRKKAKNAPQSVINGNTHIFRVYCWSVCEVFFYIPLPDVSLRWLALYRVYLDGHRCERTDFSVWKRGKRSPYDIMETDE